MKHFLMLLFLIVLSADAAASDTSSVRKDSVVYIIPIAELGSIDPYGDSIRFIGRHEIIRSDYRSLYDILKNIPGIFVRDLASPGQKNQIVINGIDDNYIGILVDGIPYNDHPSTSYNLWNFPVDLIDRIEVVTGPGSFFHDGRSSGGVINIVTKNYTNNKAITNLRYGQGVDGYVHTDAMFAQNIFRGVNLTLGLTHYGYGTKKEQSRFRGRFYNSNDDAWIFRGKIRYDITNYLNVSLTHLTNRTWTGLHGGVDYLNSTSLFDGYLSTVQNLDAYEKLMYSQTYLTAAFAPFSDSSATLSLTGYYYDRLRQYRDEENRIDPNGIFTQLDQYSITKGFRANYFHTFGFNRLNINYHMYEIGSASRVRFDALSVSDRLTLFDMVDITGNISYSKDLSYGAEGAVRLTDNVSFYAGYSSNAGPTLSDRFLRRDETIEQFQAGTRYRFGGFFTGSISATRSIIKDRIVYDTIPNSSVITSSTLFIPGAQSYDGLSVFGHIQIGEFHFEGTGNYLVQPKSIRDNMAITLYPELTLYGAAYFQGTLANGNLDLKIGIRGTFVSEQSGMKPYDEIGVWIPSSLLTYGPSGTMDIFAVGKIGDAFIHIVWENVTGNQYLLAPVYPMYDRNIRFGLSWEFLN
jgi:outer membrane receptor protein involved in Fe transport